MMKLKAKKLHKKVKGKIKSKPKEQGLKRETRCMRKCD